MLLQRILTAIPLAALVIWLILYQPTEVFIYLLVVVSLIAAFEWCKLSGYSILWVNLAYALLVTAISIAVILKASQIIEWLVYISALFWLIVTFKIKSIKPKTNLTLASPQKIMIGLLVIPTAVLSMWSVHRSADGAEWLMYGLALIWVADIGAYFSGKKFGKNKLAVNISPGKTIEGLIGALVFTTLYTLLAAYYFELNTVQLISLVSISLVLTIISVVGDLYESVLKREAGLKDSGNILPGHGGILDRIDSVLAAMPVFSVSLHFFIHSVYGS